MTNERAIELLINATYSDEWQGNEELTEANHMAIDAIEKQITKYVSCPKGFQGMRDTRFYCPACNALTRQREEFCHKCGQHVKYPKEVYDRAKNRFVFDWSED